MDRFQFNRFRLLWRIGPNVLMAWGLALCLCAAAAAQNERPNLLIVMADDQGIDAVEGACWPNEMGCHTPNLATIASRGRVFANARMNANCSPTRAALMTGRHSLTTGVGSPLPDDAPLLERDALSLAASEYTIAQLLQAQGYYTILLDKWHLGWNPAIGRWPTRQGFDLYFPVLEYLPLDDPLEVGDEHMTRMVDMAIEAVRSRPNQNQPYALFYWSFDPHAREDDGTGHGSPRRWWKVSDALWRSGEDYYDTDNEVNRYRAIVEALDTEFGRLLTELEIVDEQMQYRDESDTVVFYMADNGTPQFVSPYGDRAKGSLYEHGIRVPFVVFGERVPADGACLDRLISHVDFFETIAEVVGVPSPDTGIRREGLSFADSIGWAEGPLPEREFCLSSRGASFGRDYRVSLTGRRYKLITPVGSPGMLPTDADEFYDLLNDPDEQQNLMATEMSDEQAIEYRRMRDALVDHWPGAVSVPLATTVDVPATQLVSLDSDNQIYPPNLLAQGHLFKRNGPSVESRILARFDIDRLSDYLPPDRTIDDVVDAQIILTFGFDVLTGRPQDAGRLAAWAATTPWYHGRPQWQQIVNEFDGAEPLGGVDLAPHVVPQTSDRRLSAVPLPDGALVSLGHSDALVDWVRVWAADPTINHGVQIISEPWPEFGGDQRMAFRAGAVLRLTLAETP